MDPPPSGTEVTVVLDQPIAVYSGMVPGFLAGRYQRHELEIDIVPLARLAGARIILSPAIGLDPDRRRLVVEGRPPIPYDLLSLDVGSTVAGLDTEGVRAHAVPTRPIATLVERTGRLIERAREERSDRPHRVTVIGAGAGGVEVAFCVEQRLRNALDGSVRVTLLGAADRPLHTYSEGLSRRVSGAAAERGIEIVSGRAVTAVEHDAIHLDDGGHLISDTTFWVTGAAPHPWCTQLPLAQNERGFLQIRPTLQVLGHDDVFAVGDCASLIESPTPKAGVYAVRQGPYLNRNLRAALDHRELDEYSPQRDFLTLLNLGDGEAIGAKWGITVRGRWVMELKDRIDRRFMERFQVLAPDGRVTSRFESMEMESDQPMLCGGCAAKVGASALESALDRLGAPGEDDHVVLGLIEKEDVAAYRTPSEDIVFSNLDVFSAFTPDPWLVGRVAALNAMSDLAAKGVAPRTALALVTVPEDLGETASAELLYQVLAGARSELDRAGVTLLGGHSTTGPQLMAGLAVDGFVPRASRAADSLLLKSGLKVGDRILLTKALGTGVILHADMKGRAAGPWLAGALDSMLSDNLGAAEIARAHAVRAATDVTGFGLGRHLDEMARASGVRIEVEVDRLPALPGALELLALGERSTSHEQNRGLSGLVDRSWSTAVGPGPPASTSAARPELVYDPQTAGGLLLGVAPERAQALLTDLQNGYPRAAIIGTVVEDGEPGIDLT